MEYVKEGIRVNAVAPGTVYIPMHGNDPKEFLKTLQPLGQIVRVQDIVDAIVYLTGGRSGDRGGAARRRRCARRQMVMVIREGSRPHGGEQRAGAKVVRRLEKLPTMQPPSPSCEGDVVLRRRPDGTLIRLVVGAAGILWHIIQRRAHR